MKPSVSVYIVREMTEEQLAPQGAGCRQAALSKRQTVVTVRRCACVLYNYMWRKKVQWSHYIPRMID
jgi:hypothetical protein